MTDENALLAAIAAHPEEDTPRLVYADWLDEHDRHIQAEFIRVQVRIAGVETLPRVLLNRHVDVFRRQQDLIEHHRDELLGPLFDLAQAAKVEFARGFVSEATLTAEVFFKHRALIAALKPLPAVCIADRVDRVWDVLGLGSKSDEPDDWRAVVSAIRTVATSDDIRDRLEVLRGLPVNGARLERIRWPRLGLLDVSGAHLGDDNVLALLRVESFPALTDLDLSANGLTDLVVMPFLRSGLPRQLRRLILGGNPIGDLSAQLLAENWPTGEDDQLEHLNFRYSTIGTPGRRALLARFGGRVDLF